MAWTSHGHHIPGTDMHHPPPDRARCGGVRVCKVCSAEVGLFGPKTDIGPTDQKDPETDKWEVLENDIRKSIDKLSLENEFDIPDYILAQHVVTNLMSLSQAIKLNKEWHNG